MGKTYTSWNKSPRDLTPALWNDSAQMRCTSWWVDPQPLFNYSVQIDTLEQFFTIDSLDARKGSAYFMLQSSKGMAVMTKVVHNARQKGGGRDGAGHHDDVEVGCDFFGSCGGSFGVEYVVHEVFAVGLDFEAATRMIE